jgi:hypothetical protein
MSEYHECFKAFYWHYSPICVIRDKFTPFRANG